MIGKLYSAKYIEEHFPWSVQKYEDQYGEPATSLFGILVNEFTKKFVFGNYHTIGGPINGNPMSPYKECYVMKTTFSQFKDKDIIVPAVFFECIKSNSEETLFPNEEKKFHKVTVRKVTNDHDYFCYLAKKYGYNLSKPAPLPRRN